MSNERKWLLMTSKHSDKAHPLFWGYRTAEGDARSFGGYTDRIGDAELYTSAEIYEHFADSNELVMMLPINTWFGRVARFTEADWWEHSNPDDIYIVSEDEAFGLRGMRDD